jgi:hypothetical protein
MIAVGDYTITLDGAGMVDHAGTHAATSPATVSPGTLTTVTMDYDYAASVTAGIETYKPGSTAVAGNVVPSVAARMSAVNGDDLTILRNEPLAGPVSPPTASFTVGNLFPFSAAYSFFTGKCRYSNPTTDSANSGYFGAYPGAIAVTPGSNSTVTVRQPPLNIRLKNDRGGGTAANGMRVVVTPVQPAGDSCVEPSIIMQTFTTTVGAPATNFPGMVGRSKSSDSTYVEAGVPFGYYKICFQRGAGTGANPYRYTLYPDDYGTTAPYDNTDPLGLRPRIDLDATLSGKWHDNQQCAVSS